MKKIFLIILWLSIAFGSSAQSVLDKTLGLLSSDLAQKLTQKNKNKVVVLYITDINNSTTVAGKYIADIISYNIVNNPSNFQVFDRENLNGITEAKKLINEGYIDVDKAKQLGKLLSVDAIIIGSYTVLSNTIKLTTKALDSGNGFVIAAAMKDLPLNEDAASLLGINVQSTNGSISNNNNPRGFNSPLNSNENYNNPGTVNLSCKVNNTGDYCFTNNTSKKLTIDTSAGRIFTLAPNQTQCLYEVASGPMRYSFTERPERGVDYTNQPRPFEGNGEVYVEQCKSKTFVIK